MWPAGSGVETCGTGTPVHRQLYAYDFAGRLITETAERGGTTRTVTYGYDVNSNRVYVQWPDGYLALYQYDALDRLTAVLSDQDGDGTSSDTLAAYAYSWGRLTVTRRGASASGQTGYAGAVAWAYQPGRRSCRRSPCRRRRRGDRHLRARL